MSQLPVELLSRKSIFQFDGKVAQDTEYFVIFVGNLNNFLKDNRKWFEMEISFQSNI